MVDIVKFVLRFFSKCFSLLRCNILKNSVGRNRQLTEAVVYIAYVFHTDETRLTSLMVSYASFPYLLLENDLEFHGRY